MISLCFQGKPFSITDIQVYAPVASWMGFHSGSDGKESTCNAGDLGSIPGLGRSPGGQHDNPLQYSCLENPHGQRSLTGYSPWAAESWTLLKWLSMHTYTLKLKKWKRRTIQLTWKYGIGIDSSFFLALCLFKDCSKLFSLPIRVWVVLFNLDVNGSKLACALLMTSQS